MCGIAGYYGPTPLSPERIARCLQLMGRRGPDHAASRAWRTPAGNHVHLLHSRLNIIDLNPRSNQPFRVGSRFMVYNGELYNYRELRAELTPEGRAFETASDTEVFLTGIDAHGWPFLERCEGMWALAVYDEADESLTLCRDRFGEKPLYLLRDGPRLYFGSEVKFLFALAGTRRPINSRQVRRFLVNGYKSLYKAGETFFEGVSELPAACTLRIDASGTEKQERYWEPRFAPDATMAYDDAVRAVRERVLQAVQLRLRADVPVAFCMSGGMDSNVLLSVARRVFDYDVHGFTVAVEDERYDEREDVETAVAELGIRHTFVPATAKDFLGRLRVLVRQHDAPVYTSSYYVHWLLMQSIAEHGYRISVSGTGSDELFTGYYDHHPAYLYEIRNEADYAAARQAFETYVKPRARNPLFQDADLFRRDPGFRGHVYADAPMFAEWLVAAEREAFVEREFTPALLRNRMLNEMFCENIPVILHEDDLNAMYFSIENRSPFLDRNLFELCYRIPTRHLVRDGYAKAVLRDAMRGIVPERVRTNRRKVGFNAPIEALLDRDDPAVRDLILGAGPVFDIVRRDRIEALLERPSLPNNESKFLFSFLGVKLFLEECGR